LLSLNKSYAFVNGLTGSVPAICVAIALHARVASMQSTRKRRAFGEFWQLRCLDQALLRKASDKKWAELDLNQRRQKPMRLQLIPFNHSGIDPLFNF